jgi:hypothetical protein
MAATRPDNRPTIVETCHGAAVSYNANESMISYNTNGSLVSYNANESFVSYK